MAYVSYGSPTHLPPLGPPSVGSLGATPPVMHDAYWTMGYTRDMTAAQVTAFNQCVEAKRASKTTFPTKAVLDGCQASVLTAGSDWQKLAALTPTQQQQLVEYAKAMAAQKAGGVTPSAMKIDAGNLTLNVPTTAPVEAAAAAATSRKTWLIAGAAVLAIGWIVLRR